ncbi:MAG: AAA family ATPase [Pseudomonadota bacterium]
MSTEPAAPAMSAIPLPVRGASARPAADVEARASATKATQTAPSASTITDATAPTDRHARPDRQAAAGASPDGAAETQAGGPADGPVGASLSWPGDGPARAFYEDEELYSLRSRAAAYLRAGVAVRFQGPSGMGKTTLALRVAQEIGRPLAFLTGHSRLTSEDLIGREVGHSASRVDDKYIASVRRTETRITADWREGVLAVAMLEGQTLVYDEFTRAPPEANAALLSVLEEGILVITHPAKGRRVISAHPEFRLILTSNPSDYRGVHGAPDALLDRFVTFDLETVSAETEAGIVACATGLKEQDAVRIVRLVRQLREDTETDMPVSMRTAILIARLLAAENIPADPGDGRFIQICADVLRGRIDGTPEARIPPLLEGLASSHSGQPTASTKERATA